MVTQYLLVFNVTEHTLCGPNNGYSYESVVMIADS